MKILILGVNGQDGSYAAELLLAQGYEVVGVGRQIASRWVAPMSNFRYIQQDLSNIDSYQRVIRENAPKIIFHFAAVHGSVGFNYEEHWREAFAVNCLLVQETLEYIRKVDSRASLFYLSSSKVFVPNQVEPISEQSPRVTNCLYSLSKNFSTDLIQYYRMRFGVNAAVIWTFNHESPRRGQTYFIPTIVHILAKSLLDPSFHGEVDSLDFWCDWGSSPEFMGLIVEMANRDIYEDFVLASGRAVWAAELVDKLFAHFGMRATDHVITRVTGRECDQLPQKVDLSRLRNKLGRTPVETIEDICLRIIHENYSDLASLIPTLASRSLGHSFRLNK